MRSSCTKSLVKLQKGKIWLDSAPGKGSTFYFTLPLTEDLATPAITPSPDLALVEEREVIEAKPSPLPDDHHYHILIVDDEAINHEILQSYMREGPFQVSSSYSGQETLDMLKIGQRFDRDVQPLAVAFWRRRKVSWVSSDGG